MEANMYLALEKFKRLPLATILAARNYGMDNISAPPDAVSGAKLCMAVLRGDNQEMRNLLRLGANIDHQDAPDGWTPLIFSIYYGNTTATEELIRHGANISLCDFANRSPLMYAALRGKADLIKELIELGADPEQTDIHGKSALDFAREYSKDECIKILFQEREKIYG